jgi:long-subunit fatty acid transport protein
MRILVALGAAALLLGAGRAAAQDMNYQPFQVGGRSALMGGAVVGGVRDSSAVYYNPGALAFVEESGLSLSASALRYGRLEIEEALGSGKALDDTFYDVVPLLISGSLRPAGTERVRVGYAVVARQKFEGDFGGAVRSEAEVVPTLPGLETFLGQYDDDRAVDELWGTLVVAWRAGDRVGIGLGPVVAYRDESRRQRLSTNLQNTTPATPIAQLTHVFDSSFYQFSLLGRIGVSLEPASWLKVGLTATTPGLKLYGEGEEQAEIIFASTALGDANFRSLQEGLDTNHRTPWRAALGFEVAPAPDWRLGVSVEYVDRLSGRPVIETDPSRDFFAGTPQFIGSSPGLQLIDQRDAVVNVALGVEYRMSDAYALYLGGWTDFSPTDIEASKAAIEDDGVGSPLATSAIDVYHAVLGLSRRTRDRVLALGVTGSYGTGRIAGNLDFVGQDALLGLGSLPAVVERKASYFSTSLVISFTQYF